MKLLNGLILMQVNINPDPFPYNDKKEQEPFHRKGFLTLCPVCNQVYTVDSKNKVDYYHLPKYGLGKIICPNCKGE